MYTKTRIRFLVLVVVMLAAIGGVGDGRRHTERFNEQRSL
jgi:hypothetical protein